MPTAHHSLRAIPSGDGGTRATLKEMRSIVRAWKTEPEMRRMAGLITARCPNKDWVCEVRSVQEWVRQNIRFTSDIAEVETLQTPELTLAQRMGDCDDHSILVATLLQAIGHPARFVAVDLTGGGYSHVFTETPIGPYWHSVETTEPDYDLGDQPAGIRRRMVQRV